jgi:WD40 repeat protein
LISPVKVGALIKVPGFVWAGTYDMELWIINKRKYKVKKKINLNVFPGSGQGGLVTGAGSRIGGTGTVGGLAGASGTGGILGGSGGLGGGGAVSTNTIGAMLYRKPYVWVGTNNCIIRVDVNSQKVVDILNGHSKLIHKIIAIEDQNEIWSSSGDKTICVWDAKVYFHLPLLFSLPSLKQHSSSFSFSFCIFLEWTTQENNSRTRKSSFGHSV